MRVLSLNIRQGGGRRIQSIAEYLTKAEADILAVTEFRNGHTGDDLRKRLHPRNQTLACADKIQK